MLPQKWRQLINCILGQKGGDVKDQITQAVLVAVLSQTSSERKQRDDLSPSHVSFDKEFFCELIEPEFEVAVSVDF